MANNVVLLLFVVIGLSQVAVLAKEWTVKCDKVSSTDPKACTSLVGLPDSSSVTIVVETDDKHFAEGGLSLVYKGHIKSVECDNDKWTRASGDADWVHSSKGAWVKSSTDSTAKTDTKGTNDKKSTKSDAKQPTVQAAKKAMHKKNGPPWLPEKWHGVVVVKSAKEKTGDLQDPDQDQASMGDMRVPTPEEATKGIIHKGELRTKWMEAAKLYAKYKVTVDEIDWEFRAMRDVERLGIKEKIDETFVAAVLAVDKGIYITEKLECTLGEFRFLNTTTPDMLLKAYSEAYKGLAHIHKAGYVHLDMHFGNLMVKKNSDGSYTTKIMDMGTARHDTEEERKKCWVHERSDWRIVDVDYSPEITANPAEPEKPQVTYARPCFGREQVVKLWPPVLIMGRVSATEPDPKSWSLKTVDLWYLTNTFFLALFDESPDNHPYTTVLSDKRWMDTSKANMEVFLDAMFRKGQAEPKTEVANSSAWAARSLITHIVPKGEKGNETHTKSLRLLNFFKRMLDPRPDTIQAMSAEHAAKLLAEGIELPEAPNLSSTASYLVQQIIGVKWNMYCEPRTLPLGPQGKKSTAYRPQDLAAVLTAKPSEDLRKGLGKLRTDLLSRVEAVRLSVVEEATKRSLTELLNYCRERCQSLVKSLSVTKLSEQATYTMTDALQRAKTTKCACSKASWPPKEKCEKQADAVATRVAIALLRSGVIKKAQLSKSMRKSKKKEKAKSRKRIKDDNARDEERKERQQQLQNMYCPIFPQVNILPTNTIPHYPCTPASITEAVRHVAKQPVNSLFRLA